MRRAAGKGAVVGAPGLSQPRPEDQAAASRVCEILEADGIGCWLASRDATARKDKAAANLQAIRTSDLVLLIFSSSANASPNVLRDIERAISYERPVLSLHLDDAVPNASLEYYLNLWQWLDASGGVEDKREDIVAAVRGQLAGTADSAHVALARCSRGSGHQAGRDPRRGAGAPGPDR